MWTVKSAGETSSRSSQRTGNDTGMPGRTRGLYAATTVAPPTRVESTNTRPPRSSLMNAVVAIGGIEALGPGGDGPGGGGRVLGRRVVVDRDEDVHALGAAGLDRPAEAQRRSSTSRTSRAAATAMANPSPSGGSRSSTRWVTRSGRSARVSVGWYSTARWLANHSRVRRSLHSAYDTSRLDDSAHSRTVGTQSGVYLGTFFCMNASWPRCTRITDSGRSRSSGRIRSATPSR